MVITTSKWTLMRISEERALMLKNFTASAMPFYRVKDWRGTRLESGPFPAPPNKNIL
jgi:hypothetical protein